MEKAKPTKRDRLMMAARAALANVPFKVTSKTTGESHVLTTDANGYASTSSAWNRHTQDTNGGTAESGIWFGASEPDDSRGALLYDTYEIEEQRCESNADRALIPAFDVTVYKDSTTVNLGTLTDDEGPKIGTTATDAADGDHEARADESVTVNDEVAYENLTPGQEYTLTGTLMDKSTGKPVQSGGKDVTSTVSFVPEAASGTQTVKLVPPSEEQPPSKGGTTATGLPKTGDELPWVAILCAVGAAGCCAGVIALSKRRNDLDETEDDAEEVEEP